MLSLAQVAETGSNSALMAISLQQSAYESVSCLSTVALSQFQNPSTASSDMNNELDPCSCGYAEGRSGEAYNEEAFRYFLEIERRRSEVSTRPFLLLLVDVKKQPGESPLIPQATVAGLFAGLSLCLRETDFVGWYRQERVAGAVLTQRPDMPQANVAKHVAKRVRRALSEQLEADVSSRLQVRVYRIPPMPKRELLMREGQG